MKNPKDIEKRIITALTGCEAMRKSHLRKKVIGKNAVDGEMFKSQFRKLLKSGEIINLHRGNYGLAKTAILKSGIITVTGKGFAFVKLDSDDEKDVFVPPRYINKAISGDLVQVHITEADDPRGPTGKVKKILDRTNTYITGQLFIDDDDFFHLRPLRRELPDNLPITKVESKELMQELEDDKLIAGEWFAAQINSKVGKDVTVSIIKRISSQQNLTGDLDAIVEEFSLPIPYSDAEQKRAKKLKPIELPREDRRDLLVVTIDPKDAKDFDDGMSLEAGEDDNTLTLGVHIADVASFIQPNTEFDQSAALRGFTAYLPGRTLPMLPPTLAATTCSLIADKERRAHSVFMTVDKNTGEVIAARRCHTLLKVRQRLSFPQVQEFIETGAEGGMKPEVIERLNELLKLAETMRKYRAKNENFISLEIPDVHLVCSENPPLIKEMIVKRSNEANNLVEEFMLAANSAVATEIIERNIPGFFRVHEPPAEESLSDFGLWVSSSLDLKVKNLNSRQSVNEFLSSVADLPQSSLISMNLLTSMQRAAYSEKSSIHYGLGKEKYSHFTSPIRRYSDLALHQQLIAYDIQSQARSIEECKQIAINCTELEANNDAAYFAALDRLKMRYLQENVLAGDEKNSYEGLIARLVSNALIIYIPRLGLYSSCQFSDLGPERFKKVSNGNAIKASHSDKTYKCGDFIQVRVKSADIAKGKLTVELDDSPNK